MAKLCPISGCWQCTHSMYEDEVIDWNDHIGWCMEGVTFPVGAYDDGRRIPDEVQTNKDKGPTFPGWCPLDDAA